jgi:pectate lyase
VTDPTIVDTYRMGVICWHGTGGERSGHGDAPMTLRQGGHTPFWAEAVTADLDPQPNVGGFGTYRFAGYGATVVTVTSTADSGAGTLRTALATGSNIVVRFASNLDGSTITLTTDITVSASKVTVDGRGVDVTIAGRGLVFTGTDIRVVGVAFAGNTGAVNQVPVTFTDAAAERRAVIAECTFGRSNAEQVVVHRTGNHPTWVTVHRCKFTDNAKTVRVGPVGSGQAAEGGTYSVTFSECWWYDVDELPVVRNGRLHLVNSLAERWGTSTGAGSGVLAATGDFAGQVVADRCIAIPRRVGETTWVGTTVTVVNDRWCGPAASQPVACNGTALWSSTTTRATEATAGSPFTVPYDDRVRPVAETDGQVMVGICRLAGRRNHLALSYMGTRMKALGARFGAIT